MMKSSIRIIGVSAVVFGLGLTAGQPARAGSGEPQPQRAQQPGGVVVNPGKLDPGKIKLRTMSCTVGGTPVEFPNDIKVTNVGSRVLNAGTTINWTVNPSIKGSYKLPSALNPNQTATLSNVLGGGLEAGTRCSASPVVRSGG